MKDFYFNSNTAIFKVFAFPLKIWTKICFFKMNLQF